MASNTSSASSSMSQDIPHVQLPPRTDRERVSGPVPERESIKNANALARDLVRVQASSQEKSRQLDEQADMVQNHWAAYGKALEARYANQDSIVDKINAAHSSTVASMTETSTQHAANAENALRLVEEALQVNKVQANQLANLTVKNAALEKKLERHQTSALNYQNFFNNEIDVLKTRLAGKDTLLDRERETNEALRDVIVAQEEEKEVKVNAL